MALEIRITSDFICPWCYLGLARLQRAIAALHLREHVHLLWQPYELNPQLPAEGMDRREYRSLKFGWDRSLHMDAQLTALGLAEGLHFNFARITRTPNTRLAHRLTQFAATQSRAEHYVAEAFKAYFEQGLDIGDQQVLLGLLAELGLDAEAAAAYLTADGGTAEVVALEAQVRQRDIAGVPHFEIGSRAISGAQSATVLRAALLAQQRGT